jgi:hypothetical protein
MKKKITDDIYPTELVIIALMVVAGCFVLSEMFLSN